MMMLQLRMNAVPVVGGRRSGVSRRGGGAWAVRRAAVRQVRDASRAEALDDDEDEHDERAEADEGRRAVRQIGADQAGRRLRRRVRGERAVVGERVHPNEALAAVVALARLRAHDEAVAVHRPLHRARQHVLRAEDAAAPVLEAGARQRDADAEDRRAGDNRREQLLEDARRHERQEDLEEGADEARPDELAVAGEARAVRREDVVVDDRLRKKGGEMENEMRRRDERFR